MKFSFATSIEGKSQIGVFFIFEDLKFSQKVSAHNYSVEVKRALEGRKNFRGKRGQVLSVMPADNADFKEVLLVGLGKKDALDNMAAQFVGSKLAAYLNGMEAESATICVNLEDKLPIGVDEFVSHFYEGGAIRNYRFAEYFVDKKNDNRLYLKNVVFCMKNSDKAQKLLTQTQLVMESVNYARDLVSMPGNDLYPETFAKECARLAKLGIKVKVLDEKAMAKLGMGALLGVAMGSVKKPKLVVMEWNGVPKKKIAPIALVGKGVTFDSGGISIKPAQNMGDMKYDMAGAGAVVGTMRLLAARKAKAHVVGLIGLVENMPSGAAQRPGDVVKSMSGQTIEVDNTDAEGRLVLCDVMWYAQKTYKPQVMIDLATLTGAVVVALGENSYAGLFANDEKLSKQLQEAGVSSGDKLWPLPMNDFFDKQINSEIADMRNTGIGRGAGSTIGAQFLARFVKDCLWAHLDIAGMAWDKSGAEVHPKGATGFGVRVLNRFIADQCEKL